MTEVALAPEEHSDIVGGSSASRVLNCPASVGLYRKLQEQLDVSADQLLIRNANDFRAGKVTLEQSSEVQARAETLRNSLAEASDYADEGTKLHKVMAYIIGNNVDIDTLTSDPEVDRMFDELELKDERMFDAVLPALRSFNAYLDRIMEEDDCDEVMIRVESKVDMPGIDDAFGTTDILGRTTKRSFVWDWKFGAGVPVSASYKVKGEREYGRLDDPSIEETEHEFGNDQLMYYGRASMETHPEYFNDDQIADSVSGNPLWPVDLIICQPRSGDGEPSIFQTTTGDLENFRLDLIDALAEAESPSPMMKIGHWCRFAKCKAICPLHASTSEKVEALGTKLGKLQMLASQTPGARPTAEAARRNRDEIAEHKLEYSEALATLLDLADIVEPYINEARAQALTFMEAGGEVPGYKIVAKKPGWDSWKDDKKAEQYLGRQGIPIEDRRVVKPISPAKARDYLKGLGKLDEKHVKQLEKYVQKGVSSGYNVVRSDNPREAVLPTGAAVKALAAKLGRLTNAQ